MPSAVELVALAQPSILKFQGGLDTRTLSADSSGALAVYLSKLAMEVTGGTRKVGRGGSHTMWQVLAEGLDTGLTFSRGLRQRYRLAEEQSDEIADRDMGGDDLIALPAETWPAIRDRAEELPSAAEADGLVGAVLWQTERLLAWSWATPVRARDRYQRRLFTDAPHAQQPSSAAHGRRP